MKETTAIFSVIALADLRPSPWNARKSLDAKSLADLAANIGEKGVLVPLTVRPIDLDCMSGDPLPGPAKARDAYEIVAGWRRYNAAQIAGLAVVPCVVRELDDDQAREIGLVDNLQREDVPPLEEADAYAELRERFGSVEAIAARVNKEKSYVARRLQLVALGALPRRALAERLISIEHALILARLGEEDQLEHLKWTLDTSAGVKTTVEDVVAACVKRAKEASGGKHFGYWEPQSVLDLKDHVESYAGRLLARAPWKLDDDELVPAAGPCEGCAANTRANRTLFGDLAIEKATCARSACFESKRAAFVDIALGKAAEVGEEAGVRISWKESEAAPRMAKDGSGPNLAAVLRHGQWIEAKKASCAHVRKAATVDWSDDDRYYHADRVGGLRKPGEVLLVCVAPKCKVHAKAYETRAGRSNSGQDPKVEAAQREQQRQSAEAETKIRCSVATKALASITKLPPEALRVVVLEAFDQGDRAEMTAILPGIEKTLQSAKVESAEFAKAATLVSIAGDLHAWEYGDTKRSRDEFLAGLKRIGYVDGAKAWHELEAKPAAKPAAKKTAKKAAKQSTKKTAAKKAGRK